MADLISLACMWVSDDVNLLGHKDRWGLSLSFGRLYFWWVRKKFKIGSLILIKFWKTYNMQQKILQ